MALTNDQITAQNFKDFYNQIKPYLNGEAHDAFLPIGTIIPLMGNNPPQNTLKCDGTVYNIADYMELASYFMAQFGSINYFGGNGTTTFAVPDLRGEFLRGTGTNGHTGQGSGSNVGVHQDSTSFPNFFGSTGTTGTLDMAKASVTNRDTSSGSGKARYASASDTGSNYDVSFTARPTNTSVLYCIVYKDLYADMQDFFSVDTMPTADSSLVGKVLMYVGETDSNYTNCYWYKCISDTSTTPATYSWANVQVQDGTISMDLTYAEYDALSDEEKNDGTVYYVEDLVPFNPQTAAMGFTPVGTVISVMGNHAPTHYLVCNGQTVNISEYPELAYYFEKEFGSKSYFGGDGTTTFAVPDLRGEFLRGSGTNSHADGGNGSSVGVHQAATEIPRINTTQSTGGYNTFGKSLQVINTDKTYTTSGDKTYYFPTTNSVSSATATSDVIKTYNVRPTNTSVLYCIATKNIYITPENNYSTDEQVIGTWINNKPIYQKTISCGALPNTATTKSVDPPANMDKIIHLGGITYSNDNYMFILPTVLTTAVTDNIGLYYSGNTNKIIISTGKDRSSFTETYVTVQYTKTTDD